MTIRAVDIAGVPFRFCGRAGDAYFDHLAEGRDNDFLAHVAGLLPQDAIVFDVGANLGLTTVILSRRLSAATIHSFEPSPEAFAYLTETIRLNGLERCHPVQLAIGREPGRLSFLQNTASSSASHLAAPEDGNVTVLVSTVDAEVATRGIQRLDLIKIDVEGFEAAVLDGAKSTLRLLRPKVFLEFNTFTMMAFGDVYPRGFLERLIAEFPFVYRFVDGACRLVRSRADQVEFIHDNLIHKGCVDDLLCCWESIGS